MNSFRHFTSPSSVFSAYASVTASFMLLRTMFNQLIPHQLQQYILTILRRLFKHKTSEFTLVIEQNDGMSRNQVYDASETYLCSKISSGTDRLRISKSPKETNISVKFAGCETILDNFDGIDLQWRFVCEELEKRTKLFDDESNNNLLVSEKRYFELRFDKKHRDRVLNSYIDYVINTAKAMKDKKKTVKLHTLARCVTYSGSVIWDSIKLEHPFNFDTLAMDPDQKKAIVEDLDRFVKRKEFYKKVGKAWKRGYLLYGPPGTGKSSLIAAIANYLKFDVYDLQLMNVRHDSDWRKLLLSTVNRSILVIEDIDCSVELPERNSYPPPDGQPRDLLFSLSGLLNFIDGLWSSSGDERIIVFTTNNKERLDPALLRPGRMDMHIHMSYLTPAGFHLLASNYLNIHKHSRFPQIKELIETVDVSPAEVAEELMKSDDPDLCLGELLSFLEEKKTEKGNQC